MRVKKPASLHRLWHSHSRLAGAHTLGGSGEAWERSTRGQTAGLSELQLYLTGCGQGDEVGIAPSAAVRYTCEKPCGKGDNMATSSITRNFVLEGEEQVELFANAIEESYQESLVRDNTCHVKYHDVTTKEELEEFMKDWDLSL